MKKNSPHSIFYFLFSAHAGQSLIEVLIAAAIGVIMVTAAAGIIAPVLRANTKTGGSQVGTAITKELLDNVKVWAEGDWHNIANLSTSSASHYHINSSSSPFSVVPGNETITISSTTYTRYFYVDDVYRDSGDNISSATSGGAYVDPSTKQITSAYNWPQGTTSTIVEYITRSRNYVFDQTDWSVGPGQSGPVTNTNSQFYASSLVDYATTTGSLYIDFQ